MITMELASDTGYSSKDRLTNNGEVNIRGLSASRLWYYSLDDGRTWTTAKLGSSSITLTGDGFKNVTVRQDKDSQGQWLTQRWNFYLDTSVAAPTLSLANDTGISSSDRITSDGTIKVSGLEGGSWQYSLDKGVSWTLGTGNNFKLTGDGVKSVFVRQTDMAGNVATSREFIFTLDSLTAPTVSLAKDTGLSNNDNITRDSLVNVSGLVAGRQWEYSQDAGKTWKSGNASSFVMDSGDGAKQLIVRQLDAKGNWVTSLVLKAVLDSSVIKPMLSLANDTGSNNLDGITADGRINVSGLENMSSWQYSDDGGSTWFAGANNTFRVTGNGIKNVLVRQTDVAGNIATSDVLKFTLAAAVPRTPTLTLAKDTGRSSVDRITGDGLVNVGSLDINNTWQYTQDNGLTWVDGVGTSLNVTGSGLKNVAVRQRDVAGNTSISKPLTFYLDSKAALNPILSVRNELENNKQVIGIALRNDTGLSEKDAITSIGILDIQGLVSGQKWEYSTNSTSWVQGIGSTVEISTPGDRWIQVRQNIGRNFVYSSQFKFTLDNIENKVDPKLSLVRGARTSSNDLITADGVVQLNTSDSRWIYSLDGGKIWLAGADKGQTDKRLQTYTTKDKSFINIEEGDGDKEIKVRLIDEAGNIGQEYSLKFKLQKNIAAPVFAIRDANGVVKADASVTASGEVCILNKSDDSISLVYYTNDDSTIKVSGSSSITVNGDGRKKIYAFLQSNLTGAVSSKVEYVFDLDTKVNAPVVFFESTGPKSAWDDVRKLEVNNSGGVWVRGEENATVQYRVNDSSQWMNAKEKIRNGEANFKVEGLEGYVKLKVRLVDLAGNISSETSVEGFIDKSPPKTIPVLNLRSNTVIGNIDEKWNNLTVAATNLEAGNIVQYQYEGQSYWTTDPTTDPRIDPLVWQYKVKGRFVDVAGNVGPESDYFNIIIPKIHLTNDTHFIGDKLTYDGRISIDNFKSSNSIVWSYRDEVDGKFKTDWTRFVVYEYGVLDAPSFKREGSHTVSILRQDLVSGVSSVSQIKYKVDASTDPLRVNFDPNGRELTFITNREASSIWYKFNQEGGTWTEIPVQPNKLEYKIKATPTFVSSDGREQMSLTAFQIDHAGNKGWVDVFENFPQPEVSVSVKNELKYGLVEKNKVVWWANLNAVNHIYVQVISNGNVSGYRAPKSIEWDLWKTDIIGFLNSDLTSLSLSDLKKWLSQDYSSNYAISLQKLKQANVALGQLYASIKTDPSEKNPDLIYINKLRNIDPRYAEFILPEAVLAAEIYDINLQLKKGNILVASRYSQSYWYQIIEYAKEQEQLGIPGFKSFLKIAKTIRDDNYYINMNLEINEIIGARRGVTTYNIRRVPLRLDLDSNELSGWKNWNSDNIKIKLSLVSDTGDSDSDLITSDGRVRVHDLPWPPLWVYSVDGGRTWQIGSGNSFTVAGSGRKSVVVMSLLNSASKATLQFDLVDSGQDVRFPKNDRSISSSDLLNLDKDIDYAEMLDILRTSVKLTNNQDNKIDPTSSNSPTWAQFIEKLSKDSFVSMDDRLTASVMTRMIARNLFEWWVAEMKNVDKTIISKHTELNKYYNGWRVAIQDSRYMIGGIAQLVDGDNVSGLSAIGKALRDSASYYRLKVTADSFQPAVQKNVMSTFRLLYDTYSMYVNITALAEDPSDNDFILSMQAAYSARAVSTVGWSAAGLFYRDYVDLFRSGNLKAVDKAKDITKNTRVFTGFITAFTFAADASLVGFYADLARKTDDPLLQAAYSLKATQAFIQLATSLLPGVGLTTTMMVSLLPDVGDILVRVKQLQIYEEFVDQFRKAGLNQIAEYFESSKNSLNKLILSDWLSKLLFGLVESDDVYKYIPVLDYFLTVSGNNAANNPLYHDDLRTPYRLLEAVKENVIAAMKVEKYQGNFYLVRAAVNYLQVPNYVDQKTYQLVPIAVTSLACAQVYGGVIERIAVDAGFLNSLSTTATYRIDLSAETLGWADQIVVENSAGTGMLNLELVNYRSQFYLVNGRVSIKNKSANDSVSAVSQYLVVSNVLDIEDHSKEVIVYFRINGSNLSGPFPVNEMSLLVKTFLTFYHSSTYLDSIINYQDLQLHRYDYLKVDSLDKSGVTFINNVNARYFDSKDYTNTIAVLMQPEIISADVGDSFLILGAQNLEIRLSMSTNIVGRPSSLVIRDDAGANLKSLILNLGVDFVSSNEIGLQPSNYSLISFKNGAYIQDPYETGKPVLPTYGISNTMNFTPFGLIDQKYVVFLKTGFIRGESDGLPGGLTGGASTYIDYTGSAYFQAAAEINIYGYTSPLYHLGYQFDKQGGIKSIESIPDVNFWKSMIISSDRSEVVVSDDSISRIYTLGGDDTIYMNVGKMTVGPSGPESVYFVNPGSGNNDILISQTSFVQSTVVVQLGEDARAPKNVTGTYSVNRVFSTVDDIISGRVKLQLSAMLGQGDSRDFIHVKRDPSSPSRDTSGIYEQGVLNDLYLFQVEVDQGSAKNVIEFYADNSNGALNLSGYDQEAWAALGRNLVFGV